MVAAMQCSRAVDSRGRGLLKAWFGTETGSYFRTKVLLLRVPAADFQSAQSGAFHI